MALTSHRILNLKICLNLLAYKQESTLHIENCKIPRTPRVKGAYQTTEENINLFTCKSALVEAY